MQITKEVVTEKLREVIDPEMGVNIVDLGLIYDVSVDRGNVRILMTLTTPGCPLASVFDQLVGDAVREIEGVGDVSIELTFDPPWTQDLMSEEVKAELGFS